MKKSLISLVILILFFTGCGEEYRYPIVIESNQSVEKENKEVLEPSNENIIPSKSMKEMDDEELDSLNLESEKEEVEEKSKEISKSSIELLDEERIKAEEG